MTGTADRLVIATDGSCLGNPGPGGWSWAVSPEQWRAGGVPNTTNNIMELYAVGSALRDTPVDQPLLIEIDSQYVLKACTVWLPGWKRNGWRTADRKPVKNQQVIMRIDARLQGRDVQWRHVKGHAGHALNEVVDLRARAAATAVQRGVPVDEGPGLSVIGGGLVRGTP